jgi:hypothetical protein
MRGNGRRVGRRSTSEHRGTTPASVRRGRHCHCRSTGIGGLALHSSLEVLLRLSQGAVSG